MHSGIFPATGSECSTGCSGTGAKFPASWTLGSAVLGSGCWRSWETKAVSIASKAMDAAFCRMFQLWGVESFLSAEGDAGDEGWGWWPFCFVGVAVFVVGDVDGVGW